MRCIFGSPLYVPLPAPVGAWQVRQLPEVDWGTGHGTRLGTVHNEYNIIYI